MRRDRDPLGFDARLTAEALLDDLIRRLERGGGDALATDDEVREWAARYRCPRHPTTSCGCSADWSAAPRPIQRARALDTVAKLAPHAERAVRIAAEDPLLADGRDPDEVAARMLDALREDVRRFALAPLLPDDARRALARGPRRIVCPLCGALAFRPGTFVEHYRRAHQHPATARPDRRGRSRSR